MKRVTLQAMTAEQLVRRFEEITLAQYEADLIENYARYRRLFDEMVQVIAEFMGRPLVQRQALMTLYAHPNPQVRYMAAAATKDIAPDEARRVCEIISERNEYPQAADARGMITAIDEGQTDLSWVLEAAKRKRPIT